MEYFNAWKGYTETASRGHASVSSRRHRDGELRVDEGFAMGWHDLLFRAVHIQVSIHISRGSMLYAYLYRSYPADKAEPLVGVFAFSECFLMRSWDTGARLECSASGTGVIFLFLSTCWSDMDVA